MTITVTQEDIDYGCPRSGNSCPIARAAIRAFISSWIGVGSAFITESKSGKYEMMPEIAKTFVRQFDDGETVEPFSFEMPSIKNWSYNR